MEGFAGRQSRLSSLEDLCETVLGRKIMRDDLHGFRDSIGLFLDVDSCLRASRTSGLLDRSIRVGMSFKSSLSFMSLYQDLIGIAFAGFLR